MDTPGILALWAEDGVDLMPGDAPMIGKKKIVAWVEDIVAKTPGYKVTKQDMEFHDIRVCGDWASEWATEHQVVQPPCGMRRRSLENLSRECDGLEAPAGDRVHEVLCVLVLTEGLSRHDAVHIAST